MTPGIAPGQSPPFHRLGEYHFQDLCRDLFYEEPEIATCDVYGVRGQSQHGIDLLAHRENGDGIEVGQCKCYQDFPPASIRKASDEFLAHLNNRWSKETIRRFILFVACDLDERLRQDEICEQKQRFRALGITYEAWATPTIRNKLRPHQGIVSTYCVPAAHWVSMICGIALPSSPLWPLAGDEGSPVILGVLAVQLESLAAHTASDTERHLESMREAWREGRRHEAEAWVRDLKANATVWSILPPVLKAKIVMFEASVELDSGANLDGVKARIVEARAIDPSIKHERLSAIITLRDAGPEAALQMLDGVEDIDTLNLRAALLLEMGRTDECLALLSSEQEGCVDA